MSTAAENHNPKLLINGKTGYKTISFAADPAAELFRWKIKTPVMFFDVVI